MPSTGDSDCGSLELPMYKALLTPFIMSAIALIANALQKYKKQMRICHLRTDIFEKTSFRRSNGIKNGRKQPTNCPFSSAWRKKQRLFEQGERKEGIVA